MKAMAKNFAMAFTLCVEKYRRITMVLDDALVLKLTPDTVRNAFLELVDKKTDLLTGNINISKGADGVDYTAFEKNIELYAKIICEKGVSGKYLFSPFREVLIPKAPYERHELTQAKLAGKTRTLSISSIQDTIFQELIGQVIVPFAESKFQNDVDQASFAYRKGKSSKQAVLSIRNSIRNGYIFGLDGDIQKFFDEIDHKLLYSKCVRFFGEENPLILKYIYRFMHVSKIPYGSLYEYKCSNGKRGIQKRLLGIPQGGVLSGLLANIFLYDFDLFVSKELCPKYHIQYLRYADDFMILFKEKEQINEVYAELEHFLSDEKLTLHPIGEKTKIIEFYNKKDGQADFLGFSISPKALRVKEANVKKFYSRIEMILQDIAFDNKEQYLAEVCSSIRPKIIGLEDMLSENGYCPECHHLLKKRNWIGYFMLIDDVRLLKNMDTQIRKMIYRDYHHKAETHLRKKDLLEYETRLLSLETMYYLYKKQERLVGKGRLHYCNCKRYYDREKGRIVVEPSKEVCENTQLNQG